MNPRILLAVGVLSAFVGCAGLVGIGDLPPPRDSGAAEDVASSDVDVPEGQPGDATGDERMAREAGTDGGRDATARDARAGDANDASDAAVGDRASTDQAVDDVRNDRTVTAPDADDGSAADRRSVPDAPGDAHAPASSCPLSPPNSGVTCATCLQTNCCLELASCEAPDNTGLNDAGQSACIRLTDVTLVCIVGVGAPSSSCTGANSYSPQAQHDATALVNCVQQLCPAECPSITVIPGI